MVSEVQLPAIDNKTKQRVIDYFTALKEKGIKVLLLDIRDNLPDDVKLAKVLAAAGTNKNDPKLWVNGEIVTAVIICRKDSKKELHVVISKQLNHNAQGISCGMSHEQMMYSIENISWVEALESGN